jgi:PhnB protein
LSILGLRRSSSIARSSAPPSGCVSRTGRLYIYVDDVDSVIERAVQFGATLKRPAQTQFYGDRDGFIIDPFGHGWTIGSHVEDVPPDEMVQRMQASSVATG